MKLKEQWLVIIALSLLLSGGIAGAWAQEAGPPPGWVGTHPIIYKPITGMQPKIANVPPYTPAEVRTAYGINSLPAANTGTGQKIAIIDAYGSPTITSDLAYFSSQFGLPVANLQIYYPQGTPGTDPGYPDWAIETSLDVEWAHALAPGATICLVVAADNTGSNLFGAVQYATSTLGAQIVSMSFGGAEFNGEDTLDGPYFSVPGTVFVASSGDNGSGASYPAASPNVVAVGGTSINLNTTTGMVSSETGWSGSGGGVSAYESLPSYQSNFGLSYSGRDIPDVSMIADPNTGVWVYFTGNGGSWYQVGGTSLSTPCWAALFALVNQGSSPLTDGHQAIYKLAGTMANFNTKGDYRDITSGSNGAYSCAVGYDLVTGLGVPVANKLIPDLRSKQTTVPIYQLLMLN
ncbi:MAG TPA: S53 family peptidase [Desulfobaccales bacterium]